MPSEKSSVTVKLTYKNYKYYNQQVDTSDKIILYSLGNNVDPNRVGVVRLTANLTYTNTNNSSQPYIEEHEDVITSGLNGDGKLRMLNGSFNADTMILKLSATIGVMTCKYKKKS